MKKLSPTTLILCAIIAVVSAAFLITLNAFLWQRSEIAQLRSQERSPPPPTPQPKDYANGEEPTGALLKAQQAVWGGDVAGLGRVLDQHPDLLDVRAGKTATALLHHAAYRGKAALVEELVRRKADVNVVNGYGATPLHDCINANTLNGTEASALILLEHGANVTIRDNQGRTALDLAIVKHRSQMVELLKRHGARE